MTSAEIRVGMVFGRLTVMSMETAKFWRVRCECGAELVVLGRNLRSGNSKSCGCLNREKLVASRRIHGCQGTRLYLIWQNMKRRCCDPKRSQWKDYGGRGITVCKEWNQSFLGFLDWALANGYQEDLFIDRRDNALGYSPQNCRFVTRPENCNNKRSNVLATIFGESKTVTEWARDERCKTEAGQLAWRLRKGWSPEKALRTPTLKNSPPFCPQGHEFTIENTLRYGKLGRQCRECCRIRQSIYNHRVRKRA
jgi:hypothetical protein